MSNNITNNMYYHKYIKYKEKYITLHNLYGGDGNESLSLSISKVNSTLILALNLIVQSLYSSELVTPLKEVLQSLNSLENEKVVLTKAKVSAARLSERAAERAAAKVVRSENETVRDGKRIEREERALARVAAKEARAESAKSIQINDIMIKII